VEALTTATIVALWIFTAALAVAGIAGLGWVLGRALQIWLDQPRARRATWREN